ncbi:MAG: hypothetical protein E6831_09245 [Veillonella sp.]|nr:hypothetical protein [Veillonella sp.]
MAKLKGGFQEGAIGRQPHYDTLKEALEQSKKEGSTFKEVDTERDNVLNVLNVAQVEKFDAAYAKFNDALNKANTEQTKKQIEKLKKDGKKGYAAAMESTLRLTTLVENVEKAPKNADKQAVEKELNEIQTLLKSINNDRGEVLVNSYNSVVGSVRQVLNDANENNLNDMIENFNNYIESYNNTTPDQFDSK